MMCFCFGRRQQRQLLHLQEPSHQVEAPQVVLDTSSLQQQQHEQLQNLQEYKQGAIEKTMSGCSSAYSSSLPSTLLGQVSLNRSMLFHPDSIPMPAVKLAHERSDWMLHSSHTCAQLGQIENAQIAFGELLGSGSFGKVYKASWAGREVAVKVICHTTEDLHDVQHEAELMLGLQSLNVVKAYHYATYVQKVDQDTRAKARRNRSFRQGGGRPAVCNSDNVCSVDGSSSSSERSAGELNSSTSERISALLGPVPSSKQTRSAAAGSETLAKQPGSSDLAATVEEGQQQEQELGSVQQCGAGAAESPSPRAATSPTPDGVLRVETHLVLEYCDVGTLGAVTSAWAPAPGCQDEHMLERLVLLRDVAYGLEALHNQNVVHADLNARNVLVCSSDEAPIGAVAKLGDMGMSRRIKQQHTHRTTNTIGTLSHQPPEMLQSGYMSPASDIYAFGIMMWELYTSQPAFRKLHYGQFFEAVVLHNLRPMVLQGMPADYQLLMESCWVKAPTDRPSITRVQDCLTAMIHERAMQAAAKEAAAEVNSDQSKVAAAVNLVSVTAHQAAGRAAVTKSKNRKNLLVALISQREASMTCPLRSSSNSFIVRSGSSLTAAAAAVSRSCNSEPLPPSLIVGRSSCSITGQHHGVFGVRQPSDTWLLQRSPASFSASFGAPGCFFPPSYSQLNSQPSCPAPMTLIDAFDEAVAEDSLTEMGDVGIEIAAAAADDYFWVV